MARAVVKGWSCFPSHPEGAVCKRTDDPDYTAEMHLEEVGDEDREAFLVFPAFKGRGLPSTPAIFDEGSHGTLPDAKTAATAELKAMMQAWPSNIWKKARAAGRDENFWQDLDKWKSRRR